ncbi:hypothetical protein DPMN_097839 [Dreissena polymorpha]|uniref:Uncharacterized protein n=1 Tax=Dreissena polymorpha TaxID=45954 RepID=A0A9D4LCH0_DREPO|nr:hypothetical protein DPMN_097839 [Dreissena polymorpha]
MEPPNRPESQCWTVCKCPCSWVEKYEAEKNLTKTELEEKYKDKNEQMQRTLAVTGFINSFFFFLSYHTSLRTTFCRGKHLVGLGPDRQSWNSIVCVR